MHKLIKTWAANPTLKNANAIRNYDRKHPMARVLLTKNDDTLVVSAIYQANNEQ
jgi:hypothetical protein